MPVLGWVALSGRVVEHEHGYRAERVVIRRLRLTDGAHLVLRDAESVQMVVKELEDRYQAPVKAAWRERRRAGALVSAGPGPAWVLICTVSPAEGWQLG